jgi:hypothetical protein
MDLAAHAAELRADARTLRALTTVKRGRRGIGRLVGLDLGRVIRLGHLQLGAGVVRFGLPVDASAALDGVRELVREQVIALGRPRRKLASAKVDIRPVGKRARAEFLRGLGRCAARVNLHSVGNRGAQASLHAVPQVGRQLGATLALDRRCLPACLALGLPLKLPTVQGDSETRVLDRSRRGVILASSAVTPAPPIVPLPRHTGPLPLLLLFDCTGVMVVSL